MEELLNKLNEKQKRKLIDALSMADDILEEASAEIGENSDYHSTRFYQGLYDVMYRLGVWG